MSAIRRAAAAAIWAVAVALPAGAEIVLGEVDGDPITLEQLKREFEARHMGHIGMLGEEDTVREFLAAAVRRRLFVHEGYRLGLDEDPALVATVDSKKSEFLADWLYKAEIEERAKVDPAAVPQAIAMQKTRFEVVLVQTDTQAEAVEARSRIEGGADAQELARTLSTAKSRLRGGVESVTWGDKEPAVEREIFAAKDGEVTPPVSTDEGWVIAKVVSRTAVESADEAKLRLRAENILRARAVAARRAAFLDALRAKYKAAVDSSLLEPEVVTSAMRRGKAEPPDERPIARWDGGRITVTEFAEGIRDEAFFALTPVRQRRDAGFLLSDRLDTQLVRLEARRREAEAPPDVKALILTFEDDLVLRAVVEGVVLKDVNVTDAEISAWYAEHRSEFLTAPEIRLAIALLPDEGAAGEFRDAVRGGADFGDLARERSQDKATAAHAGVAGWVTEDRAIQELRGEPFRQPVNAVAGPVRIEKGWLVYKVLERREPRQKEESEVRPEIRRKLLEKRKDATLDAWEAKLRQRAKISLDESAVKKAIDLLAREQEQKFKTAPPAPPAAAGTAAHGGGRR